METTQRHARVIATTVLLVLATAVTAGAQGNFRGKLTDQWDNPIGGALVAMQPGENTAAGRVERTTEEDGSFQFLNMAQGDWTLELQVDGYYPERLALPISRAANNRPVNLELEALPPGGWFSDDVEFEAEGGTPSIKFNAEGRVEFTDAEGEGEGTYGIVDLAALFVVRDYDGSDEKYSIAEPVTVTFSSGEFGSLTWGEDTLAKK